MNSFVYSYNGRLTDYQKIDESLATILHFADQYKVDGFEEVDYPVLLWTNSDS